MISRLLFFQKFQLPFTHEINISGKFFLIVNGTINYAKEILCKYVYFAIIEELTATSVYTVDKFVHHGMIRVKQTHTHLKH